MIRVVVRAQVDDTVHEVSTVHEGDDTVLTAAELVANHADAVRRSLAGQYGHG